MDFAKNFLSKYGWKEGQGIGKNLDGIAKPLKANLKFDNDGLGFDKAKDFTNHWWETAFNDAANNLTVDKNANNQVSVSLTTGESIEISTSGVSKQKLKNQNSDSGYAGTFIKSRSTLEKVASDDDEKNENISFNTTKTSMTDEELLMACGGRTAHKGARHGLKLSGKLSRIEEQERQLLEKYSGKIDRESAQEVFKDWIEVDAEKKTHKKKKNKKLNVSVAPTETLSPDSEKLANLLYQNDYVVKYKSKKKKKRHRALDEDLAISLSGLKTTSPIEEKNVGKLHCLNNNSTPIRKKDKKLKKKKKRKASENDEGYIVNDDVEITEPVDTTDSITIQVIPKEKKKKKLKMKKNEIKNSDETARKIKKRKRKTKELLIQSESDDASVNDSSDAEIKEDHLAKQIKTEMEKHPNKRFKVIVENLTPFQSKQLAKSGIKFEEKKKFNSKQQKKEKKEFKKIAKQLENVMNLDEVDSVTVTEEKKKKKKKKHLK